MEIMSLQGGAAAPGQAPVMTERSKGPGASAFAALFEASAVTAEEDVGPEENGEDIDEAQDPEGQVERDAIPEAPLLASPSLDAALLPTEEETQAITLTVERAAPPVVTGGGADFVLPNTPLGAAGQEGAAPGSLATTAVAQSSPGESADAEDPSPAPTATVRESTPNQSVSVSYADSAPPRGVSPAVDARAPQPEKPAANQADDKPDKTASFDLPDQTAVAISVHEGKAATAPPEAHGSMRAQALTEPRHVLRQLGEKLSEGAEGVVEIALSPEELGKVRLVIAPGEKPAVTVFADRPETFDLLRRNAETLDRELRNAGIFGADISFSGGNEGRDRSNDSVRDLRGSGQRDLNNSLAEHVVPARPRPTVDRRIDIRI
ncbi:flagellar hook-length control protein FliK [Paracoccus aminovorans]|uniref:flagellar hook-length control protein FliK n=1 Tax=Paracoccus aminovorans TaxID=34004 RepID=UPI000AE81550|nr:flagellar hook-length control protein FliK [Paracoccus aminovorans]MDQ7777602.1 flagellar hook-length control protein FliK [Paracoccus aminovorans]